MGVDQKALQGMTSRKTIHRHMNSLGALWRKKRRKQKGTASVGLATRTSFRPGYQEVPRSQLQKTANRTLDAAKVMHECPLFLLFE